MNPAERKTNLLIFLSLLMVGSVAHAQPTAPDIREIKPNVFLMLDASGSMSRKPDCTCTTPERTDCSECLPTCGVGVGSNEKNRWAYIVEALTGEWTGGYTCEREARLGTGSVTGQNYTAQYDSTYHLDHVVLPNEAPAPSLPAQGNGILDTYLSRAKFGVMTTDSTPTLISTPYTFTPIEKSVLDSGSNLLDSTGSFEGAWSYWPVVIPYLTAPPSARFNSDAGDPALAYGMDLGIRGANATEGELVSVGADGDYVTTNAAVQDSLLGDPTDPLNNAVRPYGEAPLGAVFSDFEIYLQSTDEILPKVILADSKDAYYECRERVGILITDDLSYGELRDGTYNDCTAGAASCDSIFDPSDPTPCVDGVVYYCPYDTPEVVAARLMDDSIDGSLTKLYVIGFAPDGDGDNLDLDGDLFSNGSESATPEDTGETLAIVTFLNDLASIGGTEQAFIIDKHSTNFLADLKTALSTILDETQPGSTSRTAPITTGVTPNFNQARILSGFDTKAVATDPWTGVLEKRRIECVDGLPEEQEITNADRFQLVLNDQSRPSGVTAYASATGTGFPGGVYTRNLWTIAKAGSIPYVGLGSGHIAGDGESLLAGMALPYPNGTSGNKPSTVDVTPVSFDKSSIEHGHLGPSVTTDAARDTVVEWIHGFAGTPRENSKLGAIINSTPVVVGPIISDLPDETFNQFRIGITTTADPDGFQDPPSGSSGVKNLSQRPRVVYAASNDGIIHAFNVDDYASGAGTAVGFACFDNLAAGTELWGFIPPDFLTRLDALRSGFNWMTDGNLIVQNVYDMRVPNATASASTHAWRTVLMMGFRAGGNSYIALDVTNPCEPEFLWQFISDESSLAYGEAAFAQITFNDNGRFNNNVLHTRSVAIIPGGKGTEDVSCTPNPYPLAASSDANASNITSTSPKRLTRRCWFTELGGRVLYFVDMATGSVIHKFDNTTFIAPLVSGVSVFRGGTGATASRAYVTDADGVIWVVDFSDPSPSNWTAQAFHDMFYDKAFDAAEPAYNAPVITTNPAGKVVILQASGDIDSLDDPTVENRVVSLTETLSFNPDGSLAGISGSINWEIGVDGSDSDMLQPGEQITGPLELFAGNVFFGTYLASSASAINSCPSSGSRLWGVSYLDAAQINGGTPDALVGRLTGGAVNFDKDDLAQLDNMLLMGVRVEQEQPCLTTSTPPGGIYDQYTGNYRSVPITTATSAPVFKLMGQISGASTKIEGASLDNLSQAVASPYAKISGYVGTVN